MIDDILQPTHLIFIFVVALLVLGPKRLPEVGRSLGKGLRDFREGMAGIEVEAASLLNPLQSTAAQGPAVSDQPAPPLELSTLSGSATTPEPAASRAHALPLDPATSEAVAAV